MSVVGDFVVYIISTFVNKINSNLKFTLKPH